MKSQARKNNQFYLRKIHEAQFKFTKLPSEFNVIHIQLKYQANQRVNFKDISEKWIRGIHNLNILMTIKIYPFTMIVCLKYLWSLFERLYVHLFSIFHKKKSCEIWKKKNCGKCFLVHLKSSFRSRDIQIFIFSSFPVSFPDDHCWRSTFQHRWYHNLSFGIISKFRF